MILVSPIRHVILCQLLLVLCQEFACANEKIKTVPLLDDLHRGCQLSTNTSVSVCVDSDGNIIHLDSPNLMPALAMCELKLDENITTVVCSGAGELTEVDMAEPLLIRHRRQFGTNTMAGAGVGAAFGPIGALVGAGVGLVLDIVCIFVCKSNDPPPPNHPPQITKCAALNVAQPIHCNEGKTTATVSWSEPEAADPDGDDVSVVSYPESFSNGKDYSEGNYVVYFSASDAKGLSVTCALAFEVKVITCAPPRWPDNGYLEGQNMTFGSTCSFACKDGYMLDDGDKAPIKCNADGQWSGHVPDCKPKACKNKPSIDNGYIQCRHEPPSFGDMCGVVCDDGYRVKGFSYLDCDKEGDWGTLPTCKDVEAPKFEVGSCPNDIQVNIDSTNNTAKVQWEIPTGKDNSGEEPIIDETHNYKPGQRFQAGTHTVRYIIEDKNKNRGGICVFSITVQSINCQPPSLPVSGGQFMMYDCPHLYRLGSECSLHCRSGYPLGGVDKIQCLEEGDSNPPVLRWKWDRNGLEPFCKETDCPDLNAPTNGALACSLWDHGHTCQLQCQDGFDVPLSKDGMYVCGKSTGRWRPDDNVPDCNPKRNAHQMHLKSDLYYYTGKCNSSTANLLQIKNNFIKALNSSKYTEVCVGVPECQSKFVNVTCGPVTSSRRRRSVDGYAVYKRSAPELAYALTFDLVLPYKEVPGKSLDDVFADNENMLYDMVDVVQKEVDSGHFDIHMADLQTRSDSFGPGAPDLDCPKGTMPKRDTGSCAGCPTGRYFVEESAECHYCPYASYQDEPNNLDCKQCPLDTNTTGVGSVNATQCLEYCYPGQYSPTGMSPCAACPSSEYQPNGKATTCLPCNKGTRTSTVGSTSQSDCKAYDIQLMSGSPARVHNTANVSALTLSTWIFSLRKSTNQTMFRIVSHDGMYHQAINIDGGIVVDTNGKRTSAGGAVETSTWTHISVTIDKVASELDVYMDGNKIHTDTTLTVNRAGVVVNGDILEVDGDFRMSALYVLNRKASSAEITTWSKSCVPTISRALYTLDDFAMSSNAKVVIPSMCDAINECKLSPCGKHECENKIGSYMCHCHGGYSGKQCNIPPDFCLDHLCQNGATCVTGATNYTCTCPYGFSGSHCEIKAVDGEWSQWTDWTPCTQTCGGGQTIRTRRCDSPPNDPEGKPCDGQRNETQVCNTDKCTECSHLRRAYGVHKDCNQTAEVTHCTISCRPGLYFSKPPLPYYECGKTTGYKWNHQTKDNPSGRLPACSDVKPPTQMAVTFDGKYDTVSCTPSSIDTVVKALETKLTTLPCAKSGTCSASVKGNKCDSGLRRKRAAKSLTVTLELNSKVDIKGSALHIEDILANNTAPSSDLSHLVNQILELEKSAQQVFNDSVNFFQVTIDGTSQTITPGSSGLVVTPTVQCPSGTVRLDAFCAECPAGSYSDGRSVTLCPKGQYQDKTGQSVCKQCPSTKTTSGIGSIHVSECSESSVHDSQGSDESHGNNHDDSQDDTNQGIVVAIGVSTTVAFLIITGAAAVFVYKYVGKRKRQVNDSYLNLQSPTYVSPSKPYFKKTPL